MPTSLSNKYYIIYNSESNRLTAFTVSYTVTRIALPGITVNNLMLNPLYKLYRPACRSIDNRLNFDDSLKFNCFWVLMTSNG